jgi:hypothetical protein
MSAFRVGEDVAHCPTCVGPSGIGRALEDLAEVEAAVGRAGMKRLMQRPRIKKLFERYEKRKEALLRRYEKIGHGYTEGPPRLRFRNNRYPLGGQRAGQTPRRGAFPTLNTFAVRESRERVIAGCGSFASGFVAWRTL